MVGGLPNGKVNGRTTKEAGASKENLINGTSPSEKQGPKKQAASNAHVGGAVRRRITKWQRRRTTAALAIAHTAEEADRVLLTSMYLAIGNSLQALPSQLGQLTMWRALVQAIFIPVVGILGNDYDRILLICIGSVVWGAMSTGFGFARDLKQATAWAALSGIGLALVIPCVQAIVAELYSPYERGRAFGFLFTVSALGGMIGAFCAISFGNRVLGGLEVWRILFWAMAGLAILTCIVTGLMGVEPRRYLPKKDKVTYLPGEKQPSWMTKLKEKSKDVFRGVGTVFRTGSFLLILAGNIISVIIGLGLGYKIMYLQLLGFSDVVTAAIGVCTSVGAAIGFLIGGGAGDYFSIKFPNAARPAINQISLVFAAPLYIAFLKGLPANSKYATGYPHSQDHWGAVYGFVGFLIALFGTWPAANNAAIFAEVVPERIRTSVYAFDKCASGAIGALGAPLIGVLAERVFGFKGSVGGHGHGASGDPGAHRSPMISAAAALRNVDNARAIENGILYMTVIPMFLKFVLYGGLYWTLPKDRVEELEDMESEEEEEEQGHHDSAAALVEGSIHGNKPESGDGSGGGGERGQSLTQRMPTMQRTATIRRQLRGEQLGQRYMSVDFATLGREAIRGMLNPGGRPASELNPLAIFAGAAYDLTKDTARTSQSRAELDRKYRKTGSAVVSRAAVNHVLDQNAPEKKKARNFASLPAVAPSTDLRAHLRKFQPPPPSDPHSSGGPHTSGGGQNLERIPPPRGAPPGLPKFRASGQTIDNDDKGKENNPAEALGSAEARAAQGLAQDSPPAGQQSARVTPHPAYDPNIRVSPSSSRRRSGSGSIAMPRVTEEQAEAKEQDSAEEDNARK